VPRKVNPDIPEAIEQILFKATAKNREDRYESADQMAADVKQFLDTGSVALVTKPTQAVQESTSVALPDADEALKQGTQFARKNWIAIGAVALVGLVILLVLGVFLGQRLGQSNGAQAEGFEEEFNNSVDSSRRRGALAGLFELGDYDDQGRALFNKLLPEQKIDLFVDVPSDGQAASHTREIVGGTYSYLEDTEPDNQLLAAMQTALNQSGDAESKSVANEIGNWLEGRSATAGGNYDQAEVAYSVAIGLNDQNPATYYERSLVNAELADYSDALTDLETTLSLNEDWRERVSQTIQINPELRVAFWEQRDTHQAIADLVPKPADTSTPTPIPAATNTPEPSLPDVLPTITPTATPVPPTDTPTPSPSPSVTNTPTATNTPTPAPVVQRPASGGGTYQLIYTKTDGREHVLFVADTNGENERFLLTRAAGPSWSADGNFIFFYGQPGVEHQIRGGVTYSIKTIDNKGVGTGIVRLNANPLPATIEEAQAFQGEGWNEGSTRWASASPNGETVAYDARPGGDYRIYFVNGLGGEVLPFEVVGEQADWAPNGEQIVYRSGREGKTGIWIANRDDSGHINVTNDNDSFPTWSPDGETIAFARDDGGNVDIYTVNIDGSNLQRLTDTPGPDTLPIYTPSGDIIFRSARSGSWSIWKMNGQGQSQTEIIPNAGVGDDWAYSKMDVK